LQTFDSNRSARASPKVHSDGLTGGVCKEQGRIQRKIPQEQIHHSAAVTEIPEIIRPV